MRDRHERLRTRLRLAGLGATSAGVAFVLIFATRSDHPLPALLLGAVCIVAAIANLGLYRRL